MSRGLAVLVSVSLFSAPVFAVSKDLTFVQKLSALQSQIAALEQALIVSSRGRQNARAQLGKIHKLLQLQKQERQLEQKRKGELERTIAELESRQDHLNKKMLLQKRSIRKALVAIERSDRKSYGESPWAGQERLEAPRRRALANWVDHGLKEVEMLRADLDDAVILERRIQEEKQQLTYLFHDLKEQQSVLELNQKLQLDFLKRKQQERLSQLENYRKLKSAEAQVEHLMGEFNARMELKKVNETERMVSKAMMQGEFFKMKGKLPLPISGGKVLSHFGRTFDRDSGLNIFKKGIDISAGKKDSVLAISAGKVAFAGELPNYGKVVILDHGDHFYSLCAHLGQIDKKANELVAPHEKIGTTNNSGVPLYFEIRARNVAVNPLQWVSN